MSRDYKYPPDTSWIPADWGGQLWGWGVGSIAVSLVPFALWVTASTFDDLERVLKLAHVCWLVGVLLGLRGLRQRGTLRTLAWVGILMNICIPLIGWILAPLIAAWMLARSMPGSG